MDIALLAEAVRIFLAPALPYLIGLGGKAAEEAAKETGKAGVKKVWEKLRPKVERKDGAKEAAEDLAAHLEDPDAQAAFRQQLKKLLAADEELAGEVARELEEAGVVYQAEQPGSGGLAQGSNQAVAGASGHASYNPVHGNQYQFFADRGAREDLGSKGARVLRGGSFNLVATLARCSMRLRYHPVFRSRIIGFRVSLSPSSSDL